MILGALIPKSWIIYGLLALLIVLAVLGIRWEAGHAAVAKAEAKRDRGRLSAMVEAKGIRENVENSEIDDLIAGILR